MMIDLKQLEANEWGNHCFILGNGPSLDAVTDEQFSSMYTSIGMNRSYYKTTSTYYCIVRNVQFIRDLIDQKWPWQVSTIFYLGLRSNVFAGMPKETVLKTDGKFNDKHFAFVNPTENVGPNLAEEGHKVSNSGVFAIYVALWLGFRYIYLLGYDCNGVQGHFKKDITKGQWDQDKVSDKKHTAAFYNKVFAPQIAAANTAGASIYNCNKKSAITAWDYISIDQALIWQERDRVGFPIRRGQ